MCFPQALSTELLSLQINFLVFGARATPPPHEILTSTSRASYNKPPLVASQLTRHYREPLQSGSVFLFYTSKGAIGLRV